MNIGIFITVALVFVTSLEVYAGNLTAKIAEKHKVLGTDKFYGFERTCFEFEGCTAWIVEPEGYANNAMPWTWTMQWADAYVPRTPVLHLLRKGWHHVTIDTFKYRMNEKGLAISKAFQDYLVKDLGFAKKTCLVGLSWGGFFSTRYTASNPENVAAIYYDCPLMNFNKFAGYNQEGLKQKIGPWAESVPKDWTKDPRMPVNMADALAKAKIPILLIYGAADDVVLPGENCETFSARYKAAGGQITVVRRSMYGHHPHGVEIDDTSIAEFFQLKVFDNEK